MVSWGLAVYWRWVKIPEAGKGKKGVYNKSHRLDKQCKQAGREGTTSSRREHFEIQFPKCQPTTNLASRLSLKGEPAALTLSCAGHISRCA